MPFKIAIIGAGPGGLTLAALLHKNSVPFTVYENRSRPSPDLVTQPSGSLDLHTESGLLALLSCGLLPAFEKLSAECSEEMMIADKEGIVRYQDDGHGETRPEVSRNSLTNLLLSAMPGENIRWDHQLVSVSPLTAGGKRQLSFQDQPEVLEYDLVIGADGAWSRVRNAITDVRPHFSSINCITLTIPYITENYPMLEKLVGKGSYFASGPKKTIMSQRGTLDSARIYLMLQSSPSYLKNSGIEKMKAEELKYKLLNDPDLFATWGFELKELIRVGCEAEAEKGDQISTKALYMLEPGHTWTHAPGLTLIGDAAHLMTPFAGEGVNAAMLDALQLAEGIIATYDLSSESLDCKVKEYELNMFPRAQGIMTETWENLQVIFADDAPMGFVRLMESHGPPPESSRE